jgi:hypothetical protein
VTLIIISPGAGTKLSIVEAAGKKAAAGFGVLPAGAHESRRHLFHQVGVRAQCELNWLRLAIKIRLEKTQYAKRGVGGKWKKTWAGDFCAFHHCTTAAAQYSTT